jgi:hypothetical protein
MAVSNRIIAVYVLAFIVPGLCVAADLASTGPGESKPKSIEERRKDAQDAFEQQCIGLSALPPTPVAQVVHFSVRRDRLSLDSPLQAVDGTRYAITFTDMPGKAIFRTVSNHGFKFISFEAGDFSDPALIENHLQVMLMPANLQVVQDIEYADPNNVDWTQSVTLIQQLDPRAEDQITLRVQTTPESGEGMPVNLALSASSFTALRGEHPTEFEQYVRPTFRSLRQDPIVFGVDDKVAWQVLSASWKPSGDIASKVTAALTQLDADDYPTRAAAEKQLDALGEPAALYLMSIDRSALTPEKRARCDKFLAGYRPLPDEEARDFGANVNFLLDCLYSDDASIRSAALERLSKTVGHEVKFDSNQPPADRIAAIRKLREQLAPAPHMVRVGR